jgi:hypothetical protein
VARVLTGAGSLLRGGGFLCRFVSRHRLGQVGAVGNDNGLDSLAEVAPQVPPITTARHCCSEVLEPVGYGHPRKELDLDVSQGGM